MEARTERQAPELSQGKTNVRRATLDVEIRSIKDIPNGVYLTGFFSNYPTQQIMDEIFAFLNKKNLVPACGKVYNFESICDAVAAQDGGKVNGKIVVRV